MKEQNRDLNDEGNLLCIWKFDHHRQGHNYHIEVKQGKDRNAQMRATSGCLDALA